MVCRRDGAATTPRGNKVDKRPVASAERYYILSLATGVLMFSEGLITGLALMKLSACLLTLWVSHSERGVRGLYFDPGALSYADYEPMYRRLIDIDDVLLLARWNQGITRSLACDF